MLLNRVRCEAMEKIRVYFDRNLCRFLPPKESIFLICDTLLSFHNKNAATKVEVNYRTICTYHILSLTGGSY